MVDVVCPHIVQPIDGREPTVRSELLHLGCNAELMLFKHVKSLNKHGWEDEAGLEDRRDVGRREVQR